MTPAEIKTARESLRLDGRYMAELLGVSYVTLRRWESRGHIPAGVGAEIEAIQAEVREQVKAAVAIVRGAVEEMGGSPEAVHLVRYQFPDDAERHLGDRRQALLHTAVVTGVYDGLRALGIPVRLVMMDEAAYGSWRHAAGLPDNEQARAAWAGLQLAGA